MSSLSVINQLHDDADEERDAATNPKEGSETMHDDCPLYVRVT